MQEYIDFMKVYCDFYDEMVDLWQRKVEILRRNMLHEMENQSKREEAGMLRARGLEKRRLDMQTKIGYPNVKLQTMIDQTQGTTQQELREIKTRLNRSVTMLKSLNETCAMLVEDRLNFIDEKVQQLSKASSEAGQNPNPSVMNRSI